MSTNGEFELYDKGLKALWMEDETAIPPKLARPRSLQHKKAQRAIALQWPGRLSGGPLTRLHTERVEDKLYIWPRTSLCCTADSRKVSSRLREAFHESALSCSDDHQI